MTFPSVQLAHATITGVQNRSLPSAQAITRTPLITGSAPLLHALLGGIAVLVGIGSVGCLLALLIGGLLHTQIIHDPDAPTYGKRIIRYALIGLGVMGTSTLLVKITLAL